MIFGVGFSLLFIAAGVYYIMTEWKKKLWLKVIVAGSSWMGMSIGALLFFIAKGIASELVLMIGTEMFLIGTGLLCINFLLEKIAAKLMCKTKVKAKVEKVTPYTFKCYTSYTPYFSFKYEEHYYKDMQAYSCSESRSHQFDMTGKCEIYINAKNPYQCYYENSLRLNDFLMAVVGICFLASAVMFCVS